MISDKDFEKRRKEAVEEGSRFGHLNKPKTDALELSLPEMDIVKKSEENIQADYMDKKEILQSLENKEVGLQQDVYKMTSPEITLEMSSEIEKAKIDTKTSIYKINEIRKEKDRAKKHCRNKLKYAGVDAVEGSKSPLFFSSAFITLLLLLESLANAYFLGKGDSMGMLGGFIQAIIIASLSVMTLYIAGYIYTNIEGPKIDRNQTRTILAIIWAVSSAIVAILYHTTIGWYRYAIVHIDPEAAIMEAIPLFAENLWNLYDLHCLGLVTVGLLFALFAFHSGTNLRKNHMLWVFAVKEEDYRKAGDRLTAVQGDYLSLLNEIFNKYLQRVNELLEDAHSAALEFKQIYAHTRVIESELYQVIEYEYNKLNLLLRSFRDANIAVRDIDSPAPKHFTHEIPINLEKYPLNNIEILDRSKDNGIIDILFKDIRLLSDESKQRIREEYEKALHNSSEIINNINNFGKEATKLLRSEETATKAEPMMPVVAPVNNDIKDSKNDVPSVELDNGYKAWYKDKKLHRVSGPAVIRANGKESYYIKGKRLTEEEFKQIKEENTTNANT